MKLYLKWLNRYERQEGEEEPIGLILCAGGSREQIELLEMDKDGIVVAEYWTTLPPKAEFEEKIRLLLAETRERLVRRSLLSVSFTSFFRASQLRNSLLIVKNSYGFLRIFEIYRESLNFMLWERIICLKMSFGESVGELFDVS